MARKKKALIPEPDQVVDPIITEMPMSKSPWGQVALVCGRMDGGPKYIMGPDDYGRSSLPEGVIPLYSIRGKDFRDYMRTFSELEAQ